MKSHLQRYNSSSKNVIQIINVESKHWICASNIHYPAEVVDVYDSKPSCSGSHNICTNSWLLLFNAQLSVCMFAMSMYVCHVNAQRRSGPSDCDIFAIAFATALCMGIDPYTHCIDQKKSRTHLLKCFEQKHISAFP